MNPIFLRNFKNGERFALFTVFSLGFFMIEGLLAAMLPENRQSPPDQFLILMLMVLWALIIATGTAFHRLSHTAAWMLVPYGLWVTFAGYLNIGIAMLN